MTVTEFNLNHGEEDESTAEALTEGLAYARRRGRDGYMSSHALQNSQRLQITEHVLLPTSYQPAPKGLRYNPNGA